MRRQLTNDRMIGVAMVLGAGIIFASDMTPVRGAADGAAYGVVVAAAGYFGRRAVINSALLAAFFTVLGPLLGAEDDETLLQIVSGRMMGLAVIGVLASVLLHLLEVRRQAEDSEREIAAHHAALLQIARHALLANTPFKQRLAAITEMTVDALRIDAACVAHVGETGSNFRLYDVWNRRLGRHFEDNEAPASYAAEVRYLMDHDLACPVDDVLASPLHQDSLDYFRQRNIRAVLHTAALYRERSAGSLIASCVEPHHWTQREISFAKSVSHIVALLFAVHQSERTLERLDLVSQGILVESPEGRIEYANSTAREILGCGAGDCSAMTLPFALQPLQGDSDGCQIRFNSRELEIYRRRLPDESILTRIDDVTARNAAMAESKRMEALLDQSAKLNSMGQLAAGVAHDFNNMLGAIMGFAQLLAKRVAGRSEESVFADRILRVCNKGKDMTDEILAYARTSSVERAPIDLAQVVRSSLDVIPADAECGVPVTVSTPQERLGVLGNAAQLTQLIQNLVVNARHACEGLEGAVTISAGHPEARELHNLILSPENPYERLLGVPDASRAYCFVRVADNGHGIPPENLARIFEPFFTTKARRRGSGLGLAVVHRVVEAHGGCCHVRSEPGKGTVFTIYIPLLADAAGARPCDAGGAAPPAVTHGSERVLLVDDDIDVADALMAGLQLLGYRVEVSNDPRQALDRVRASPGSFDVLVTDQLMPGLSGLELAKAVRSQDGSMKIILLSGADRNTLADRANANGIDALLHKPIGTAELAHRIRLLFKQAAADAA